MLDTLTLLRLFFLKLGGEELLAAIDDYFDYAGFFGTPKDTDDLTL